MSEGQLTKRKFKFFVNEFKFFVVILILVGVLAIVAGVSMHFCIGPNLEATDISDLLTDQLNLGSNFTVDDILKSKNYSYGWMKLNINVEVLIINPEYDEEAENSEDKKYIASQDILSYDAKSRTFTVCGIGAGIIDFRNPLDASVGFQVPFSTKFAINDTILILKENYPEFFNDGLIVMDEIESVDELRLTYPRLYSMEDFAMFPNLSRILLTSSNLLQLDGLEKIDDDIVFYVNDGLYDNYMSSSYWTDYRERVFPIVDSSAEKCVLVFDFRGGWMASASESATRYFSSVNKGGKINLSDFEGERTGYTFFGWFTSNDNGITLTTQIDENYEFKTDTKLYAGWTCNIYSIIYDANGGVNPPSNQKNLVYGEGVKLSSNIPTWTGHVFKGWSREQNAATASWEAGESVSDVVTASWQTRTQNSPAEDAGVVILYAVWTNDYFLIRYDANGGENAPAEQKIEYNSSSYISSSKPTRTGYTLLGWSYTTGGSFNFVSGEGLTTKIINEMYEKASGSPKVIKLYAHWSINYYKITIEQAGGAGGSITGVTNGGYYKYGTHLTIQISYIGNRNRCYTNFDGQKLGEINSYSFYMPAKDITIIVYSDYCIATGTLIMLADGTSKKVEELNGTETILSWDFYTGELIKTKVALLNKHGDAEYQVVNLQFADGNQIKIIGSHGFMDATSNDFVYIDETNYQDYIGHQFIKIDSSNEQQYYTTELVNAYVTTEYTGAYSVWAANGLTCVTNNMLSVGPHGYLFGFGLFDINDMKYDEESMAEAIEKYGLYSYEEFSDYLTYEQFMAFNGQYAKIAVGMGLITEDKLIATIKRTVGKE